MNKIKIIKMLGKSFAMASIILLIFALLAPAQASYNQTDNGTGMNDMMNVSESSNITLPDLTVKRIEAPQTIYLAHNTKINTTIENIGKDTVGAFNVTLRADESIIASKTVPSLNSNRNLTLGFDWTPNVAGTFNLSVIADSNNEINESNETNNELICEVNVTKKNETHIIHVPTDYPAIQKAIDNSSAGDVIYVDEGSYGTIKIIGRVNLTIIGAVGARIHYGSSTPTPGTSYPLKGYATGVNITNSSDITISGFVIDGGGSLCQYSIAVLIAGSENITISGCKMDAESRCVWHVGGQGTAHGVVIYRSHGCNISKNELFWTLADSRDVGPADCIHIMDNSTLNTIAENSLRSCKGPQIRVDGNNNTIYHNNIYPHGCSSGWQWHGCWLSDAIDDGKENRWDYNHWYNCEGTDKDRDRVGDMPYNISGTANATDNHPLMQPHGKTIDLKQVNIIPPPKLYTSIDNLITAPIASNGTAYKSKFNVTLSANETEVDRKRVELHPCYDGKATLAFKWKPYYPGIYNISISIDPHNAVNESNEENNELTREVNVLLPDIYPVSIVPSKIYSNYTNTIRVMVDGVPDVLPFNVTLLANGTVVDEERITLSAKKTVEFTWKPTHNGTHNLTLITDKNNETWESNEENNVLTKYIDVRLPDLSPSVVLPSRMYADTTYGLTIALNAEGVPEDMPFNVLIDADGDQIDQTVTLRTGKMIKYEWETGAGLRSLAITADSNDDIIESDETNNELRLNVTVHPFVFEGNYTENINKALEFLSSGQKNDGSIGKISYSSWASMAIIAAGDDPHTWTKKQSLIEYQKNFPKDNYKYNAPVFFSASDWAEAILAITCAGEDPRDFGGINYVESLRAYYDGEKMGYDETEGNHDLRNDCLTILALIAAGEHANSSIVQNLTNYIIEEQKEDGSWEFFQSDFGKIGDTSVVIQTLSAVGRDSNNASIRNGLNFLNSTQNANGGFPDLGDNKKRSNSFVTARVILALIATGENPMDWKKNGKNPIDCLLSLQDTHVNRGYFKVNTYRAGTYNEKIACTCAAIPALAAKPYPVGILVQRTPTLPDMYQIGMNVPDEIYVNTNCTVNATIRNNGGRFNVTPLADGVSVDEKMIRTVWAYDETDVSFRWKPDHEGEYNLTVVVDQKDEIIESDEDNNLMFRLATVVYPDLYPTKMEVPTSIVNATNILNVTVKGRTDEHFSVSLSDNGMLVNETRISGIFGCENITFYWRTHETGTHELIIFVDSNGEVVEGDEENNKMTRTVKVIHTDLYPKKVDVPPIFANATNPINVTISGAAPHFNVSLYVRYNETNQSMNETSDETMVDKQECSSEFAGQDTNVTLLWKVNRTGRYDMRVFIDSDNEVREINEENNNATIVVKASLPDLRPIEINTPDHIYLNETNLINVTIRGAGDGFNVTLIAATLNARINETANNTTAELRVHNLNTSKNFSTIRAAIDDSDTLSGHTIMVDAGTYNETVYVNKSLTIRSTSGNPDETIVQAANSDDPVFEITANCVNISGFTVVANAANMSGIYLWNRASHCTITNNIVSAGICGIFLNFSSDNTLINNNNVDGINGILLHSSDNNTIISNYVRNNSDGIHLNHSNNNTLVDNIVDSNINVGLQLENSSSNLIFHNNLINNMHNANDNWAANNSWYDSILLEGNYWSDYTGLDNGNGTEKHNVSDDGIGDSNIPHPAVDYDEYPFIHVSGWLPAGAPNITHISPITPVNDTEGASRTFTTLFDRPANVMWYINNSLMQTNTDIIAAEYTNQSARVGMWNVSAIATNAYGTKMWVWQWCVSPAVELFNITVIGKVTNISFYGNTSIPFEWTPDEVGIQNITAILDSDHDLPESNETNNNMTKEVCVFDRIPIILKSPKGGEIWTGMKNIEWIAPYEKLIRIDIAYSPNGGESWIDIAKNTSNTSYYAWNTEDAIDGDQYVIRLVASGENAYGVDQSDLFTIYNKKAEESWSGFHANAGFSLSNTPDDNTITWMSSDIGVNPSSSLIVADGKIFVYCTEGYIVCLDEKDGQVLWNTADKYVPPAQLGSWSTPAYHAGDVFVTSGGPGGVLQSYDANTGLLNWGWPFPDKGSSVNGGPCIAYGKIFVGSWDGGHYYGVSEKDVHGVITEYWNFSIGPYAQSTPSIGYGNVYFGKAAYPGPGAIYCVDADDGTELWSIPTAAGIWGSLTVANGMAYVPAYGFYEVAQGLYAIDAITGKLKWSTEWIPPTDSTPAYAPFDGKHYLYVAGGGWAGDASTYCFDADTGNPKWHVSDIGHWTNSPVVSADRKVFVGKPETGFVPDYIGLYCLDALTGDEIWHSDYGGSTAAIANGKVYTSSSGRVYAFGPRDRPDIVPQEIITYPPIYEKAGNTVDVIVENTGKADVEVAFNISLTCTREGDIGKTELSASIPSLRVGENKTASFRWTPPASGTYHLQVEADPERVVNEPHINNTLTKDVPVLPIPEPDIEMTGIDAPPVTYVNEQCPIIATIVNNGKDAYNFKVTLEVKISGASDDTYALIGEELVSSLGFREMRNISFIWTPNVIGNYTLKVFADAYDVIKNESDENNNINTLDIEVKEEEMEPELPELPKPKPGWGFGPGGGGGTGGGFDGGTGAGTGTGNESGTGGGAELNASSSTIETIKNVIGHPFGTGSSKGGGGGGGSLYLYLLLLLLLITTFLYLGYYKEKRAHAKEVSPGAYRRDRNKK